MSLDIKTVLPYLVILASLAMTWGMWSERLEAVETKANSITQMKQDIAVIKEKIIRANKVIKKKKLDRYRTFSIKVDNQLVYCHYEQQLEKSLPLIICY